MEPFCEPWLFNPWGQSSLGQAQIFIGLVLLYSVHGTLEYPWQTTGAPIWAGIIVRIVCLTASINDRQMMLDFVHSVSQKTVQNCFRQNFGKFPPILIIVGRKMAKTLKLCEMYSFSTSPNLRHHTTVFNADVPNCYTTL